MSQDLSPSQASKKSDQDDPIYLSNFRVSADGDWLCLKEIVNEPEMRNDSQKEITSITTPQFEKILNYANFPVTKKDPNPVSVERNNLVNIIQLVIKEAIDCSAKYGYQLSSDHILVQHFFIVLEHILKHGMKTKKGLLGHKKDLWDLVLSVESRMPEAADITESVRNLPNVKTNMGRVRAWLRLALMQKKLSDYFNCLILDSSNILREVYESTALLRSEEGSLVSGLLVGLNVIDCNVCLKEEDLDSPPGVIDFSFYLKSTKTVGNSNDSVNSKHGLRNGADVASSLSAMIDQKTYVEEVNKTLTENVSELERKVEQLTTTNTLLKEDLDMANKALSRAHDDNRKMTLHLEQLSKEKDSFDRINLTLQNVSKGETKSSPGVQDISVNELISQRDSLKNELNLQMSLKAEMEMAMKLLERDVYEKQNTIVRLRDQLDDVKDLNIEMYSKLQECELDIARKGEMVAKLEEKTQDIGRMLSRLNQ